jgi:hypothetical protein
MAASAGQYIVKKVFFEHWICLFLIISTVEGRYRLTGFTG